MRFPLPHSGEASFEVPLDYALRRMIPRWPEILWGYHNGVLHDGEVVTLAVRLYDLVGPENDIQERIALLFPGERSAELPLLMEALLRRVDVSVAEFRAWLFVALSWTYEHHNELSNPFEVVEVLYFEFGYPGEIAGFVRYMPPPSGGEYEYAAVHERWRAYLVGNGRRYGERVWTIFEIAVWSILRRRGRLLLNDRDRVVLSSRYRNHKMSTGDVRDAFRGQGR
ncbi:DUF2247 family protein [Saccharomonospora cyanea]|uniref:Uncharacterized protein n=1 Tax=Saccharomonospora cyanea NA-134 TaxID=882082 RepID=H5XPS7_9PSEU|nr:DUF2247 family protein [Saccharomonospora cyanea]EHR61155.1 hypothetical protein SaccyDRAFT_2275 [Saccharomonospora cyanea NA-134]